MDHSPKISDEEEDKQEQQVYDSYREYDPEQDPNQQYSDQQQPQSEPTDTARDSNAQYEADQILQENDEHDPELLDKDSVLIFFNQIGKFVVLDNLNILYPGQT